MHAHVASHAGQKVTSGGNCFKTVAWYSTCSKASECRSDPKDPCEGDCVCDTSGVNECTCKTPDTGSVLHKSEEIDKAFGVKDAIGPALFGLVDGFFSGMAGQFKQAFEDPKCESGKSDVANELKNVVHRLKNMWFVMKSVHKKVWTSEGRKAVIFAVKALLQSIVDLLKKGLKFLWDCPATKMLVVMVGVIAVMLMLNVAMMAAGLVVIPLLIKYAGMIMGLYFSFNYMKGKVIRLYRAVKKIVAEDCDTTCKKGLVEDSFAMAGAILEIIVMSGLGEVVEFKVDKAKPFFKRFGIGWHDTFKADMMTLANAAKRAKEGKGLAAKLGFKSRADDVVPGGGAKAADDAVKKGTKNTKGNKNTKSNVQGKLDTQVSRSSVEKELRQAYIQRQDEVARTMGKKPQYMKMEKWQKRNADIIDTTFNQRKMDLLDTMMKGKKNELESLFPKETIEKMDDLLSTRGNHFEKKLDMVLEASSKNPKQLKNELDYLKARGEIDVMKNLKGKANVKNLKIRTKWAALDANYGKYGNNGKHGAYFKHFEISRVGEYARSNEVNKNLLTLQALRVQAKFRTSLAPVAAAAKANILAQESGNSKISGKDIYRQAKAVMMCLLPPMSYTIGGGKKCGYNIVDLRGDEAVCSSDVNFGIFGNSQRLECVINHLWNRVSGWLCATLWFCKPRTLLELGARTAEPPTDFTGVEGTCFEPERKVKATRVFQGMDRTVDDFYKFDCKKHLTFCECLVWVGVEKKTVVFTEGKEKLVLKGDGEGVQYEYCPPEGCPASRR
eukprot:g1743.t1